MKITFFCTLCENIGVEYISALLKNNNHETDLIFESRTGNEKNPYRGEIDYSKKKESKTFNPLKILFTVSPAVIAKKILNTNPDIVGFSVFSAYYALMLSIAQEIKKQDPTMPVLMGGIHPTCVPESVIAEDAVDYVCVGEGEHPTLDLLNALEKKESVEKIQNIWSKKDGAIIKNELRPIMKDLDSVPFPDKDLFKRKNPFFTRKKYSLFTSRGCKFSCTYCYNSAMKKVYPKGNFLRKRSIENVLAELKYAQKTHNPKIIYFFDDILFYDKQWMIDFCAKYKKEIGLPFGCNIHPRFMDEEIAKTMKDAGCFLLTIGVQTVYKDTRTKALNRTDSMEDLTRAMDLSKKYNIFICANIIYNLPMQTEQELIDIAKFFQEHPCDFVMMFNLRYHPKTDIVDKAKELNLLSEQEAEEIGQGINYHPLAYHKTKPNRNLLSLIFTASHIPKPIFNFILRHKIYEIPTRLPSLMFYAIWIAVEAYHSLFKSNLKQKGKETIMSVFFYISNYCRNIKDNIFPK